MDFEEIQHAIESLSGRQQSVLAKWLRVKVRQRDHEERAARLRSTYQKVFFKSPALLWSIASLLLFPVVESLVFRLGWYNKYLEPASSAGMVENHLYWLKRFPHAKVSEVLMIGDSRVAEDFSARTAGAATGNRIQFWNFGIGGTTPRVWYYILRDADPTRRRFAAIAIALDDYADEDHWDSPPDRFIDLNFVVGRLGLSDCRDFASSMKSPEYQTKALSGCLLRGITMRRDAQEFLRHVPDRIRRSKDLRVNGRGYNDGYTGIDKDLRGLSADFVNRTIHFPPGLTAQAHGEIQTMVMPDLPPQTGEMTRYRKLWLGRILDLYKDSSTRIIFLELPRAPLPRPENSHPPRFLQWALGRPLVSALPSRTFRDLERPELFADGLHLNKTGRALFTERIAAQVPPLIGIP